MRNSLTGSYAAVERLLRCPLGPCAQRVVASKPVSALAGEARDQLVARAHAELPVDRPELLGNRPDRTRQLLGDGLIATPREQRLDDLFLGLAELGHPRVRLGRKADHQDLGVP